MRIDDFSRHQDVETRGAFHRRPSRHFEKPTAVSRRELCVSLRNVQRDARGGAIELIAGRDSCERGQDPSSPCTKPDRGLVNLELFVVKKRGVEIESRIRITSRRIGREISLTHNPTLTP